MPEWSFDADEYARTRQVSVAGVTEDGQEATLDADGFYRWTRTRTGADGTVVSQSRSEGFTSDRLNWAYRNAVKENYPLHVPVPQGIEELVVTQASDLDPATEENPDA